MAKIKFSAEFDNPDWQPISIETTLPDKFAWVVYRKISPKAKDFKEKGKTE